MSMREREGLVARMREREGLIARIRQVRATAAASDQRAEPSTPASGDNRVHALETRVADLEELVQGLQDSVHRASARHSKLISELQSKVQPAVLGAALSKDARDRGL
jgi:uncharacterized coiled-coil protein SlyX